MKNNQTHYLEEEGKAQPNSAYYYFLLLHEISECLVVQQIEVPCSTKSKSFFPQVSEILFWEHGVSQTQSRFFQLGFDAS